MAKAILTTKPRTVDDWWALGFEISTLFSGAPVAEEQLFAGRSAEVRRILEAVFERSKHVVLFGERGVGKTSIANVFWKRYNRSLQTFIAARVQTDPSDDFSSLWRKALTELRAVAVQIGRQDMVPISTDYEMFDPDIIRRELQKCAANALPIIIIDEFDKLEDEYARKLTANTIKSLYDYSVTTTLIIVGVSENIDDLIEDHQSIVRALSQIKLERMSDAELNDVIDTRITKTPLRFSGDARWTIVKLSRGLPYFTQVLSKFAALNAVDERRLLIDVKDVDVAMGKFIEESEHTFKTAYRLATESNQKENFFAQVLLACALAQPDESGFFTPTDVIDPYSAIIGKRKRHAHFQRHLTEFLSEDRGSILIRRGAERQYKYRFRDPMMQPFVIIRGIRDRMIDDAAKTALFQQEQLSLPNVS